MTNKPKSLDSGIKLQLEAIKPSIAGRIELIMDLMGGQEIRDEHGNVAGKTPRIITKKQALKLLSLIGK